MLITATIPGKPVASMRPRFSRAGGFVRTHMPEKSQSYKAFAQHYLAEAMREASLSPCYGAVAVEIDVFFECPKSQQRKREPTQQRLCTSKPDVDNIAKQILDAGNGVAWIDDAQVAQCLVRKFVARQGEPSRVVVRIEV